MLDNLNLIHMNGRVYDETLGRFLSADPFVVHPTMTQSFNRYSYVQNNPLAWIDPSGFEEIVVTGTKAPDNSGHASDVNTTSPRSTDFLPGRDVGAPTSAEDRDVSMEEVVVCGNCRGPDGPPPFVRGKKYHELAGERWLIFTASKGWGFNVNKITEFDGQGAQIGLLAPDQSIQQLDPSLGPQGNEELVPKIYINEVTGQIQYPGEAVEYGELKPDAVSMPVASDSQQPAIEPQFEEVPVVLEVPAF
jgi:RHS repeat-associated protein